MFSSRDKVIMEEKGIIMKKNGPLSSFYGPASGAVHKVARKKPDAEERGLATVS